MTEVSILVNGAPPGATGAAGPAGSISSASTGYVGDGTTGEGSGGLSIFEITKSYDYDGSGARYVVCATAKVDPATNGSQDIRAGRFEIFHDAGSTTKLAKGIGLSAYYFANHDGLSANGAETDYANGATLQVQKNGAGDIDKAIGAVNNMWLLAGSEGLVSEGQGSINTFANYQTTGSGVTVGTGAYASSSNESTGSIPTAYGHHGESINRSTGTITTGTGVRGDVRNVDAGGTFTTGRSIHASAAGAFANLTKVYIDDNGSAPSGANFAIASDSSADSYATGSYGFNGNLIPAYPVDIKMSTVDIAMRMARTGFAELTYYISGDGAVRTIDSGYAHIFRSGTTETMRITSQGQLCLGGTGTSNGTNTLNIFSGTAPTTGVTDGVVLYSEDVSGSAELKVRDEAGNITTLSPHNFSGIPNGASEPMAWSYFSQDLKLKKSVNCDMMKAMRLLEALTGETLVYITDIEDEIKGRDEAVAAQEAKEKEEIEASKAKRDAQEAIDKERSAAIKARNDAIAKHEAEELAKRDAKAKASK